MKRTALLLVLPLLVVSACDRRPTPPNVIPPNMAAKADAPGLGANDPSMAQKTP